MLRIVPPQATTWSVRPGRWYLLMTVEAMLVLWMHAFGGWLDHASRLTAVATLGGHHIVVMVLALLSFTALAGLTVWTRGLAEVTAVPRAVLIAAGLLGLVALAGLLSFLVVAAALRFALGGFRGLWR